jgi:hypothetical protein
MAIVRLAGILVLTACGRVDFDPAERVVCPATYQPAGNSASVYRMLPDSLTWFAGESACQVEGAHLVVLDDLEEESAVLPLIPPTGGGGGANVSGDEVWIGISDLETEGVFLTVRGDPATFLPWDSGEPNDSAPGEDCAQVFASGGAFNDLACDSVLRVMCECTPN